MAETTSLVAALAAAQAEFPAITRNREGAVEENRRYKYADLAEVLAAVRPGADQARHRPRPALRADAGGQDAPRDRAALRRGEAFLCAAPAAGRTEPAGHWPGRSPTCAATRLARCSVSALRMTTMPQDSEHVRQPEPPHRPSPPRQITPPRQPVREDRRYAA